MRLVLIALAAAIGSLASPSVAHPEHAEDRPQRRPIAELAKDSVVRLVTQAKLPTSWARAKAVKSEMRTRAGAQQWVVTFQNPAERNRAKRMLYVIMSTEGSFISANHRLI